MKALELHNRLRRYGFSVRRGIIYNERGETVGNYTACKSGIEEISVIPEIDDKIAKAVLGLE